MIEADKVKKSMTRALKELKTIQKKMWKNIKLIKKYSLGTKPIFDTEEIQKAQIKALIQSNMDHFRDACILKKRVDYTNIMTEVEINGEEYSLHTLLYIRMGLIKDVQDFELDKWPGNKPIYGVGNLIYLTFKALSDTPSLERESKIDLVRFYDEVKKQKSLQEIEDLINMIDEELEDINLKTKLMLIKE